MMLSEISALFAACFHVALSLDVLEPFGRVNCLQSKIDRNVTIRGGRSAAKIFKTNESIHSMPKCIAQCCGMKDCDVAFMIDKKCYAVFCKNLESCAPKKNENRNVSTMVSYVARAKADKKKAFAKTAEGEPALTEVLEAEIGHVIPLDAEDEREVMAGKLEYNARHKRSSKEWKDLLLALGCGLVAVGMGVAGVILMTRRLVEDEGKFERYSSMYPEGSGI